MCTYYVLKGLRKIRLHEYFFIIHAKKKIINSTEMQNIYKTKSKK